MHMACGGVLGWGGRTFQSIFGWHREESTVFARLWCGDQPRKLSFNFI